MTRHPRGAATKPRAGDPRAHWIMIAWLAKRQGGHQETSHFHLLSPAAEVTYCTPVCYDLSYNQPLGPRYFWPEALHDARPDKGRNNSRDQKKP